MKYVTELGFRDVESDSRRLVGVFSSTKEGLEEAVRVLRLHVFSQKIWDFECIYVESQEIYDGGFPTLSSPETRHIAGAYRNTRGWEGGPDEFDELSELEKEEWNNKDKKHLCDFVEDALSKFLMDPTPAELANIGYVGENALMWLDREVFEADPEQIENNKFEKFLEALTAEQNVAFEALMDSCDKVDGRFIPRDGGLAGLAFDQSLNANQLLAWKYFTKR